MHAYAAYVAYHLFEIGQGGIVYIASCAARSFSGASCSLFVQFILCYYICQRQLVSQGALHAALPSLAGTVRADIGA